MRGDDINAISDPDKSTAAAYGVLHERGFALRHTFYIDLNGKIIAVDRKAKPATSAEDMAAKLAELGVALR